ncbi:MAG: DSD1 family PLP-dependent enzyme [Thermomicrobiales bacterium]|nr:DSD1 family PLP-dependent enzyme [Thermomicrobiales bacterium]
MLTTFVGLTEDDLDTPALVVDIDTLDRNIAHVAKTTRDAGVQWRPHAKGHKTPAIANRYLQAGAIGATVAKVSDAEVMAAGGIRDILIANQIVGPIKTRRLMGLIASTGADVIVAVDSEANARELDEMAGQFGVRPRVVIEVDSGMKRCGIAPGEPTVALAKLIASLPNLRFAGVMAWEGHTVSMPDADLRKDEVIKAVTRLTDTAEAVRAAGIPVDIVSCGGGGTYLTSAFVPGVTEVQAGGVTMGDGFYRDLGAPVEPALFLITTVVSRPAPNRIIVDAGRRAIDPSQKTPDVPELDGVTGLKFSAEHGTIQLDHDSDTPKVGDRIKIRVNYTDQAVHLHDTLFGVRDGKIVSAWTVQGRGKIQ